MFGCSHFICISCSMSLFCKSLTSYAIFFFELCWLLIDGLVQERCNSIANALELRLSCTNPSLRSGPPQAASQMTSNVAAQPSPTAARVRPARWWRKQPQQRTGNDVANFCIIYCWMWFVYSIVSFRASTCLELILDVLNHFKELWYLFAFYIILQ